MPRRYKNCDRKCQQCRKLADALAELLDAARYEIGEADTTVEYATLYNACSNAALVLDSYVKEVPHGH